MNNTNAINELVNFLTANPETPKMVAQGIIESIYACNPSEMDKVAPYFAYLLEFPQTPALISVLSVCS